MIKELTCIVCPMGCQLKVEAENNKVISVTGNTCKRGEAYAIAEIVNPERVITTTVKTADGHILPVKTDKPVPKAEIFNCMEIINRLHPEITETSGVGDVVLENILNTGANIVITAPIHWK